MVIATHGRGFYVLDDIVPLRALAANPADAFRLFPLAAAVRLHEPDFVGTPMPKDEPLAPNPPFGAMIDYSLPTAAPVEIAIYDPAGALVNRFTSSDPIKPLDLATLAVAPEWAETARPPSGAAGHHRFVWDLHYARPTGLKDAESIKSGVWAPPGRYVVEITAGGQHLRQPLDVVADPRLSLRQADFEAEFRLARQVEQARVRVRSMLERAAGLKSRVVKAGGSPNAEALAAQLSALVGEEAPIGGASAPATLTAISEWLDNLARAVDGADAAPTPDALRGVRHGRGRAQCDRTAVAGVRGGRAGAAASGQLRPRGRAIRCVADAPMPSTSRGKASPSSRLNRRS